MNFGNTLQKFAVWESIKQWSEQLVELCNGNYHLFIYAYISIPPLKNNEPDVTYSWCKKCVSLYYFTSHWRIL